jgi:hypothetical protein
MSLLAMTTKGGMFVAALLGSPARSRVAALKLNISILPRMPASTAQSITQDLSRTAEG